MPTFRLNGWQRLWVILGVLILALAILLAWDNRPTRGDLYHRWAYAQWEETEKYRPELVTYEQFKAWMKESTDSGIVLRANRGAQRSRIDSLKTVGTFDSAGIGLLERIDTVRLHYEREVEDLLSLQILYWAKVGGWWAGIMAVLYLGGWSVGWIFRGFFPSEPSGHHK